MSIHEKSVIVNAPVHKVYTMWENFEDFPKYMSHVEEVKLLDADNSHWRGRIDGIDEEWDARTTSMEKDKNIAWKSISGFENCGEVRFDPVDGGTKVTVHFEYDPPAGVLGDAADAVYVGRKFDQSLTEDLDHFKELVEEQSDV